MLSSQGSGLRSLFLWNAWRRHEASTERTTQPTPSGEARVPFYGSYTETDPVQIAVDGVDKFQSLKD